MGPGERERTDAGGNESPSVSIVIPAHNSARYLETTLMSVVHQTLTDWECVLVDDGSTDETFAIAHAHATLDPRIRVSRIDHAGASAARNHGFLQTSQTSEFVTFMDSDDIWLPHALETLRREVEADGSAAGAHGLAEMIDARGEIVEPGSYPARGRRRLGVEGKRLVEWPLDRPTDFSVLVNGNVLFPPGLVLARRKIYEKTGRFDERFQGPEDWDMLIRLSRYGHLVFCNEIILHYRMHGANLGSSDWVPREAWLIRCKAFHSPENGPEHIEIARRGWRAYQRSMIGERWRSAFDHLRSGQIAGAANALARVPVHVIRFARGYPRPRVRMGSQPWEDRETLAHASAPSRGTPRAR